jgi:hypothetical protein
MKSSNPSDKFPKQFVDMLDDMITDSTSDGSKDLLDDLLDLFYSKVKDCRNYYQTSIDRCDHYIRQVSPRMTTPTVAPDKYAEILKALGNDTSVPPDYC